MISWLNSIICLVVLLAINLNAVASEENYQNIWAVKIDGDVYKAKDVARRNNFELIQKARFWLLVILVVDY